MEHYEMIKGVDSVKTLAHFIGELRLNLIAEPSEWENPSLERFLEAMEAWINTIDSYEKNTGDVDIRNPSWKTFAKILYAAKVYE
jgi:hypothetical protein